jgi:hypothetical protein
MTAPRPKWGPHVPVDHPSGEKIYVSVREDGK